ncbi:MAG TPA: YdeI/OmpD-associated family protein [Longimicrobium sp.]|nr:YdeI/OmpD-associated family protein [Longimicrobium sp.]
MKAPAPELPIILFEDEAAWAAWLDEHHEASPGAWLRLAKKGAAYASVSYAEALDVALCYGWIDSQKKTFDQHSFLQKFGPRGARSLWSKVNREKVHALTEAGRMKPAGILTVESAKADGRWDAAYDPASTATVPDDLQAALNANPKAKAFFATLDGANRYAILFRVQTAKKPETRARRIATLVQMLERNEKIHG